MCLPFVLTVQLSLQSLLHSPATGSGDNVVGSPQNPFRFWVLTFLVNDSDRRFSLDIRPWRNTVRWMLPVSKCCLDNQIYMQRPSENKSQCDADIHLYGAIPLPKYQSSPVFHRAMSFQYTLIPLEKVRASTMKTWNDLTATAASMQDMSESTNASIEPLSIGLHDLAQLVERQNEMSGLGWSYPRASGEQSCEDVALFDAFDDFRRTASPFYILIVS